MLTHRCVVSLQNYVASYHERSGFVPGSSDYSTLRIASSPLPLSPTMDTLTPMRGNALITDAKGGSLLSPGRAMGTCLAYCTALHTGGQAGQQSSRVGPE